MRPILVLPPTCSSPMTSLIIWGRRTLASALVCRNPRAYPQTLLIIVWHLGQIFEVLWERWKALNNMQREQYEAKAKTVNERLQDGKPSYSFSIPPFLLAYYQQCLVQKQWQLRPHKWRGESAEILVESNNKLYGCFARIVRSWKDVARWAANADNIVAAFWPLSRYGSAFWFQSHEVAGNYLRPWVCLRRAVGLMSGSVGNKDSVRVRRERPLRRIQECKQANTRDYFFFWFYPRANLPYIWAAGGYWMSFCDETSRALSSTDSNFQASAY